MSQRHEASECPKLLFNSQHQPNKIQPMPNHVPITTAEFTQLSQAYARFSFIRNATIKQANDDAELRGLTEFMAQFFIDHAAEFLGCWHVLRAEYEPLIGVIATLARRVSGTNESRQAMEQSAQAKQAAPPEDQGKDGSSIHILKP